MGERNFELQLEKGSEQDLELCVSLPKGQYPDLSVLNKIALDISFGFTWTESQILPELFDPHC